MTLLLTAAPLYLTYKMYRTGVESEARQGAILEAAHDAIITMDSQLAIREFNPAAEQMFGHARLDVLLNNAGAMFAFREESVDGIEMTLALNHLAYFQLTNLLLDALKARGTIE